MIHVDDELRLAALLLGHVDGLLRCMATDGVGDPPSTLRLLLVGNPALRDDAILLRYGPMVRAIRATFTFQNNSVLVEAAIERCIQIVESLL